MTALDKSLLDRMARGIGRADGGATASILAQAATYYGGRPVDEMTVPTGFDPIAARLFEAMTEAAFLVANADHEFDAGESVAFRHVVSEACKHLVQDQQLDLLLSDFAEALAEDGIDRRALMVARMVVRRDHQLEVLRVAALMAHISGGVGDAERDVLKRLARGFELDDAAVEKALADAEAALAE